MSNTAKNFVLQLGALIALYVSLSAFILVAFGVISLAFPDPADEFWRYNNAQSGIRFGIAMLIVFFPAYIVLTRIVNQVRRREEGVYLTLTKWLIYLSLLVGGGILLGDLVAVIHTYLNGEITTRFILKALTLLVVIGAAFYYYILDAREYWNTHETKSKQFGAGATALVILVLVLGFYYSDTPAETREQRIDAEQINDLRSMQWRIEEYYRVEGTLPDDVAFLYSGIPMPEAPDGREAYVYSVTGDRSFELCATFVHESQTESYAYKPVTEDGILNPYNWDHGVGRTCFERFLTE